MSEQKTFEILGVTKWNYVTSRVLGASQKPMKDTPQVIRVRCNKCRTTFEARESNSGRGGTFSGTLGGMQITCARCGAEDNVPNSELPE